MKLSDRGADLLKEFEGFRSCPYLDLAGTWTIGYGSTKGVGPKTPCITPAQAEARMRREIDATYGKAVNDLPVDLTQNQHDALVSFVYNLGPGAISSKTGIGRALRAKKWELAANEMLRWDKAGGRSLPGLARRRRAERALFLKDRPKPKPKPKPKGKPVAKRKQLSKNFNVSEFDCHNGQKVKRRDHDGLQYLCRQFLEPLRARFGPVHINSGYRPQAYNASIGGASRSYHNYDIHSNDQAADVTCARGTPKEWHAFLAGIRRKKRGGKGGLGLYSNFVHIDIRNHPANWRG